MRKQPLPIIQELIQDRYLDAKAVFWAGSVAKNRGTKASDLDLIIVYEQIPNAYREAFIYEDWPIDAFIHDSSTLRYFFEESRTVSGIPGLISMIIEGVEVTTFTDFSKNIKSLAEEIFKAGPGSWDKERVDKERFLITDLLEDIKFPGSREEQIASTAKLYESLLYFYFRSQKKWSASGKSIIRYLQQDNPELALEFTQCFEKIFQTGNAEDLEIMVKKILAPFGGLLWDGFKSYAKINSMKEA